jgi:hypothetical protein
MLKIYDLEQQIITDLNKIDLNETTKKCYKYNDINFLTNIKKKSKNLFIFFHGSVPQSGTHRIIFRCHNYEIYNSDLLSITDGLINKYYDYKIGWFLSTKNYDFHSIYKSIFEYFINSNKYKRIIFSGTSAGGYPSLYWASYFNKIALISNSQIYLEEYGKKFNYGYSQLIEILTEKNDELIYEGINNQILKSKPEKIIIFNNILDSTYDRDVIPFMDFIMRSKLENLVELNLFKGGTPPIGKTQHHINFPNNLSYFEILHNYVIN